MVLPRLRDPEQVRIAIAGAACLSPVRGPGVHVGRAEVRYGATGVPGEGVPVIDRRPGVQPTRSATPPCWRSRPQDSPSPSRPWPGSTRSSPLEPMRP